MKERYDEPILHKFLLCKEFRHTRTLVLHARKPHAVFQISCYDGENINVRLREDMSGFSKLKPKQQEELIFKLKIWWPIFCDKDYHEILTMDYTDFSIKPDDVVPGTNIVSHDLSDFKMRVIPLDHPWVRENLENPNFIEYDDEKLNDFIFELLEPKDHPQFLIDSAVRFFWRMFVLKRAGL